MEITAAPPRVRTSNTCIPDSASEQVRKAEAYLDRFSQFTVYKHRKANPYLKWLMSQSTLDPGVVYQFMNFWFPVSRHQPQILWRIMAAYPDWSDRHLVYLNAVEEDGHVKPGDDPHYDLLAALIVKLGGRLAVDADAEELVERFHKSLNDMTPAQATGYIAAIEHPALDISDYFTTIVTKCGYPDLLKEDPYLFIHVDVEPRHLIWSHGNALDWMEDDERMTRFGYRKEDVISAFRHAMQFWDEFWRLAFAKLGYLEES